MKKYVPLFEEFRKVNEFRKFTEEDVVSAARTMNVDISMYDMEELVLGMNIEAEHGSKINNRLNITGDDPVPTLKIVLAHEVEGPNTYYRKYLIPAEKQMEAQKEAGQISESETLTGNRVQSFDAYVGSETAKPAVSVKYRDVYVPGQKEKTKYGAGIMLIAEKTGRTLLGLRSDSSDNANTWSTFGGMFNEDEKETDSQKAALRELSEETGWDPNKNPLIGDLIPAYIYETPTKTFKFFNYIGVIADEFTPLHNEDEFKQYQWFNLEELKAIPRDKFHFGIKLVFENDGNTIKKYMK